MPMAKKKHRRSKTDLLQIPSYTIEQAHRGMQIMAAAASSIGRGLPFTNRPHRRKRAMFELRYGRGPHPLGLPHWDLYMGTHMGTPIVICLDGLTKQQAVIYAAKVARLAAPSELIIKTRKGRIGKGGSSRRTYGDDPRRTKG